MFNPPRTREELLALEKQLDERPYIPEAYIHNNVSSRSLKLPMKILFRSIRRFAIPVAISSSALLYGAIRSGIFSKRDDKKVKKKKTKKKQK